MNDLTNKSHLVQLPTETLILIFKEYMEIADPVTFRGPAPWDPITHTCRKWRDILFSSPECFTRMKVEAKFDDPYQMHGSSISHDTKLAESRYKVLKNRLLDQFNLAGNLLVRLSFIDLPDIALERSTTTRRLYKLLVDHMPNLVTYSEHSSQLSVDRASGWFMRLLPSLPEERYHFITHLRLSEPQEMSDIAFEEDEETLHGPLPQSILLPYLRLLYLESYNHPWHLLQSFSIPKLEELLILYGGIIDPVYLQKQLPKYPDLRAITLDCCSLGVYLSRASLCLHPNLQSATIFSALDESSPDFRNRYIPNVANLTLHNVISPEIVRAWIVMNDVQILQIQDTRRKIGWVWPKDLIWMHKLPNLRILKLGRPTTKLSSVSHTMDREWSFPIPDSSCDPDRRWVENFLLNLRTPVSEGGAEVPGLFCCPKLEEFHMYGMTFDELFLIDLLGCFHLRNETPSKPVAEPNSVIPSPVSSCVLTIQDCKCLIRDRTQRWKGPYSVPDRSGLRSLELEMFTQTFLDTQRRQLASSLVL